MKNFKLYQNLEDFKNLKVNREISGILNDKMIRKALALLVGVLIMTTFVSKEESKNNNQANIADAPRIEQRINDHELSLSDCNLDNTEFLLIQNDDLSKNIAEPLGKVLKENGCHVTIVDLDDKEETLANLSQDQEKEVVALALDTNYLRVRYNNGYIPVFTFNKNRNIPNDALLEALNPSSNFGYTVLGKNNYLTQQREPTLLEESVLKINRNNIYATTIMFDGDSFDPNINKINNIEEAKEKIANKLAEGLLKFSSLSKEEKREKIYTVLLPGDGAYSVVDRQNRENPECNLTIQKFENMNEERLKKICGYQEGGVVKVKKGADVLEDQDLHVDFIRYENDLKKTY